MGRSLVAPLIDIRQASRSEIEPEGPVGLCHGTFDLIHPGHLQHFREAKSLVKTLICGVTSDNFAAAQKGTLLFSEAERAENLRALRMVDGVVIVDDASAAPLLEWLKPDIYFKGPDYAAGIDGAGNLKLETELVTSLGGRIHFTGGQKMSSTRLKNSLWSPMRGKSKASTHLSNLFQKFITELQGVEIPVVGEAIEDIYIDTTALGKSGKYPLVAFQEDREQKFLGGSLAMARNLASLGAKASVVHDGRYFEDLSLGRVIQVSLAPSNPRHIRKKRWVDGRSDYHLFETYEMSDFPDVSREVRLPKPKLEDLLSSASSVIFIDYGHGLFDQSTVDVFRSLMTQNSGITISNAQQNAGNSGQNNASKWKWTDHLVLNGTEMQGLFRHHGRPLSNISSQIHELTDVSSVFVTQGKLGFTWFRQGRAPREFPAQNIPVAGDRTGAGDAALIGLASVFAAGLDMEEFGDIVNLLGQFAIQGRGNELDFDPEKIASFIRRSY